MGADRLGIVRPCAISGPRDPSLSFHYWLSRLQRDHLIVAPGDGTEPVELVDVRDVANWVVANVEAHRAGPYDTCAQPVSFATFLAECKKATGGKAQVVWVDRTFLEKQGVGAIHGNMPFWNPDNPEFEQVSSAKARRSGWATRSLAVTARDAWRSYADRVSPLLPYPQHQWTYDWGISEEHEAQILTAWNKERGRPMQ
jgi:2'-hydroxyisoflavone reductase